MITTAIRSKFFPETQDPGYIYKPPIKGFSALLADSEKGSVEYIPNDTLHTMCYKLTTMTELSEAQLKQIKIKLDRLHAFNMGAAVTFRSQVKDLLKKNVDEYNPGLVVEKIMKLLTQHQEDLKMFADIQHLDTTQLTIDDQRLWEAQMDGRTT